MKNIIIPTLMFIIGMAIVPVGAQYNSEVNNGAFNKLVKIKYLSFMFSAPGRVSVTKEGVALPLFIMQLMGYVLSFIFFILNLLFYFISETLFLKMTIITVIAFFTEIITCVIIMMVLTRLSRSKQYFKRDKRK